MLYISVIVNGSIPYFSNLPSTLFCATKRMLPSLTSTCKKQRRQCVVMHTMHHAQESSDSTIAMYEWRQVMIHKPAVDCHFNIHIQHGAEGFLLACNTTYEHCKCRSSSTRRLNYKPLNQELHWFFPAWHADVADLPCNTSPSTPMKRAWASPTWYANDNKRCHGSAHLSHGILLEHNHVSWLNTQVYFCSNCNNLQTQCYKALCQYGFARS